MNTFIDDTASFLLGSKSLLQRSCRPNLSRVTVCLSCIGKEGQTVPITFVAPRHMHAELFHTIDIPVEYEKQDAEFCAFYARLPEMAEGPVQLPTARRLTVFPVAAEAAQLSAGEVRAIADRVDSVSRGTISLIDYAVTASHDVQALLRLHQALATAPVAHVRLAPPPGASTEICSLFIGADKQVAPPDVPVPTIGFSTWQPWPFPTTGIPGGITIMINVRFLRAARWYGLIQVQAML